MRTLLLIILLALLSTNIVAQTNTVVDADGNGLIEINDLETLNAIRFQLDGSSYKATAGAMRLTAGCPNNRCIGYELTRDLDFNDDDSYGSATNRNRITWTAGAGWHPIGDSSSNAFTGKFEGNGFTISNLTVDRNGTSLIGLFGYAGSGAEIANLGLLNVRITGNEGVGGLVGWNNGGSITNSYATGSVSGGGRFGGLGGLVGRNNGTITNSYATSSVSGTGRPGGLGGLVGFNEGTIMNSYAMGSVSGEGIFVHAGGLVGWNNGGSITNSYATGSVSGSGRLGGLVGSNSGTTTNSYATGSVSGSGNLGGLVGVNTGTITDSHWDTTTSGIQTSVDGRGETRQQLQAATDTGSTSGEIYYNWSTDDWDFGTSVQYPILKYTDNPRTDSSKCSGRDETTTDLPVCGSLLSPALRYGLSELHLMEGGLSPDFDVVVPSYRGTVVSSASTIQFRLITVNPDAKVYITANEETRSIATSSGDASDIISLNTDGMTIITIEVENGDETTQTIRYTLYLNYYEFNGDVDRDNDGLIEVDNLEGLNAMRYQPDGTGYRESETAPKVSVGCPNNQCRGYELMRDLDFNDADSYDSLANRTIWTTGEGWQPVGDFSNAFTGKFEGNDHTISNLTIDRSGTNIIGLFGYMGNGTEIANLGLLNVNIVGGSFMSSLVGYNFGTITNSYATGSVSGGGLVGGLVGCNNGTITNSYATGSVEGIEDVGGLAGENSGTITNSYATGSVSGGSVGGLVGSNSDTITNSYATSSVTGTGGFGIFGRGSRAGGLVGDNAGTITNSHAKGSVSGLGILGGLVGWNNGGIITNSYAASSVRGFSSVGGLVARNEDGTITNSYATGSVRGDDNVGGLVGANNGTITNSYATGSVRGDENVGGLVGSNIRRTGFFNNIRGTITNSYATSSVRGNEHVGGLAGSNSDTITNSYATGSVRGNEDVGGLVGENYGTITNSYWDISTSGIMTSAGGMSKTTLELQSPTTATRIYRRWNRGNWDFGTSSQYPNLKYTDNPNTDSRECRSVSDTTTDLPVCGSLLSPTLRYGLSELQLVEGNLSPDFDVVVPSYRGTVVNSISTIQFRPITINLDAKIYITANEETRGVAIDSDDESDMISLDTDGITTITIEVENRGQTTQTVRYTLYLNYYEFNRDIDRDNNGLIEIDNLEGLNAIRYQLDGTGYRKSETAPKVVIGCPNNQCRGYELTKDLDFNDADSYSLAKNRTIWTTGAGWRPVGASSNAFRSKFEGNGFTISNLMIDRSDTINIGLFGYTGSGAEITNIGLLNMRVIGDEDVGGLVSNNGGTITNSYATGSVSGRVDLGGLVGENVGTITNSYATGSVSGRVDLGGLVGENVGTITNSYATGSVEGDDDVGGLVGFNRETIMNSYATGSVEGDDDVGGLVGFNRETITNSYTTGSVEGDDDVGGLVGGNNGTITNSYATGSVKGDENIGGLVGRNNVTITNSYATGSISGDENVGGLVGGNNGTITNSYWDIYTTGIETSTDGRGKTTQQLQAAIDTGSIPSAIYYNWSTDDWDFGSSSQYPILKYTDNPNTDSSECRSVSDTTIDLPVCGSLLSPTLRYGLSELHLVEGGLSPDFNVVVPSYRGTVVSSASTIRFRPITVNPDAKVYITADEEAGGDESGMISLNTDGITTITIEVENEGETTQTIRYTLYLNYYEFNGDVDRDDDGLIEIDNLEGLNAMRYQLDGTGYRESQTAPRIVVGCPNNGCIGYELTRDLDFNEDGSYSSTTNRIIWTMGAGWQPTGDSFNAFSGKFEGNGFTISNLRIDRSSANGVGLFGYTGSSAEISNLGLLNVNIGGSLYIGGLVGFNEGTITNSYATGSVSGSSSVGGLVGFNEGTITNSYATGSVAGSSSVGGLVGFNEGTITNSYATGSVAGDEDAGGLVGFNDGIITNSYATGSVLGRIHTGGLVGWNRGTITTSYATGSVAGDEDVGGLVGDNRNGTITNSYWDVNTGGIQTSAGGTSKTTAELKAARTQDTDPDKPYYEWSTTNWDFGTSIQYPVLKYTDNPNTDSSECLSVSDTTADLPTCGSLLSPTLRYGLSELQLVEGNLSPDFDVVVPNYRGTVVNSISTIQLRPITVNPDAKVYIAANEEARSLAIASGDESSMISLNTDGITTITIEVENRSQTTQTVIYTLYLNYYEFNGDVDRDDDGLIEIDNLEGLNAIRYQLDGTGYRESQTALKIVTGCPNNQCRGYELTKDLDFNEDGSYSSTTNRIIWTTGAGWQPIGDFSNAFSGRFDGKGYTISGLMISRSESGDIGLFGSAKDGAEIANVGLLNVSTIGNDRFGDFGGVGGLVGLNRGTITNSYATGSVSGGFNIGGLVGDNVGTVTNSYAAGSIRGNVRLRDFGGAGGLVGLNRGTITNSYATGSVGGNDRVGGLVGDNGGTIMNSYATGSVGGNRVGGLVGDNGGTIMNSYATGSVRGDEYVGGLVGDNGGTIMNSYATGSVRGDEYVGGLVGFNDGTITNSYATGSVRGLFDVGGLVGSITLVENSYWDTDTSGIQMSIGGIGKSTVELQSPTAPGSTSTQIYYNWSTDVWDFGTSIQYPAVKYALGDDTSNPACDAKPETPLPRCGSLLPGQRDRPRGGNTTPMIITTFPLSITLLEGIGTTLNVVVSDTDDDDLVVSIASDNKTVATAIIIATDGGSRTLEITGVGEGEATITATVDDGRDTINSIASLVFRVTVEANEAPTLEIISSSMPTIEAGSTANIVISVRDQNFDVNDMVAVTAMSSNQSVVSVIPTEFPDITENMNITFTLTAGQAGAATITFTATDNGGQEATIRSDPYRVANESPVIQSITAPEMTDEGAVEPIVVNTVDANRDRLTYTWRVNSGPIHAGINVSGNPATFRISDYFITDDVATKTTVELGVTVSDGIASTTGMVSVIVNKRDNGDATLRTSLEIDNSGGTTLSTWTASVASEDPDGGTSGTIVYQWQVCEGNEGRCPSESNWMDIGGAIGTPYEILGSSVSVGGEKFPLVEESSLFRVRGTYKDNQGYDEIVNSAGQIYTTRPALMIRAKVFLEGPLQ